MKIRTYNSSSILAIIAISGFIIGSEVSALSAFLGTSNFHQFFGALTKRDQALLAASHSIGAVVGCVICGTFCDSYGCVLSFQVSNILWIVGSVVAVISEYIIVLILGRIVKGVSIGFISCLVPVYIFELFPAHRKGSSISVFHLNSTLGTVVIYFVGYVLEDQLNGYYSFKATWAIEAVPAVLLLLLSLSLPESPKWLASQSKWVEAAKTLERVRTVKKKKDPHNDELYVTRVYTAGNKIKYCHYSNLFGKLYWPSTCVGILLHLFIQLTCVTTLMYFFTYICGMCGLQGNMKIIAVSSQYIILGMLTLIPVALLDKGRRVDFLTYGILVIGITFAGIFAVMYCFSQISYHSVTLSPFDWTLSKEPASAILALFLFLVSVYASSITSVSWLYTSEIFPDEARAKGTAVCMCVSWIVNAITTLCLPFLFQLVRYWIFLPMSAFCILGAYIFSTFPETKEMTKDIFISGIDAPTEELPMEPEEIKEQPQDEQDVKIDDNSKEAEKKTSPSNSSVRIQGKPRKIDIPENSNQPFEKLPYKELKSSSTIENKEEVSGLNSSSSISSPDSGARAVNDVLKMYSSDDEVTTTSTSTDNRIPITHTNSRSEDSYFSNDWNQNQIEINPKSSAISKDAPIHQPLDIESNNSDDSPDWSQSTTHLVGKKEIQPTTFLQFDTLRVASKNYYRESKPTNPIKKSKNMLHST